MPASSILLEEKDFKLNDTTTFISTVKSSIGSGINVLLNKKNKTNLNSESNKNNYGNNQGPNDKNSKSQEFKTQESNNNLRDKFGMMHESEKEESEDTNILIKQKISEDVIINKCLDILSIKKLEENLKEKSKHIYHELEFFNSNDLSGNTSSLYKILNHTKTIGGDLYFKNLLLHPVTDINVLKNRQNNLLYFYSLSDRKKNVVHKCIEDFKELESDIFWNIAKKSSEMEQMLKMIYFKNFLFKHINKKEFSLSLYYYFIIVFTPLWSLLGPVIFFFLPYLFSRYVLKVNIPFSYYWNSLKNILFGNHFFTGIKMARIGFRNMAGLNQSPNTSNSENSNNSNPFNSSNIENNIKNINTVIKDSIKSQQKGEPINLDNILNNIINSSFNNEQNNTNKENVKKPKRTVKQKMRHLRNVGIDKVMALLTSNFAKYVYMIATLGSYMWGIYNSFLISQNYSKLINFIHDKLNKVRHLLNNSHHLIYLYESSQLNESNGSNEDDNSNSLSIKSSQLELIISECKLAMNNPTIKKISNSSVFMSKPSILVSKGVILKSFYLLKDKRELLYPFIKLHSWFDAWYNSSQLLKFCSLPKYLPDEKPYLLLEGCFSPSCQSCVGNTIELGGENNLNNCLLTGPNGSGKSTFLKSVMSSVILGQTLGITPTEKSVFTPFEYCSTYLNIPDCQGKESLFQAEMSRCHQHLNNLKQLENRKRPSLNIMDEIFVSTNYQEGMSGAYAVIKNIQKYNHSLNIITTHFDKLLEFPLSHYQFKHFTITSEPDNEDIIHKDYKLYDGVNKKHLALHLLKLKGFDSDLISDAKNIYKILTDELIKEKKEKANIKEPIENKEDNKEENKEEIILDILQKNEEEIILDTLQENKEEIILDTLQKNEEEKNKEIKEENKEDSKEEIKEESKEESIEKSKEESIEKSKEDKEESKEEIKEESKENIKPKTVQTKTVKPKTVKPKTAKPKKLRKSKNTKK